MHDQKLLDQFRDWGLPEPEHHPHGTVEEIQSKGERLIPTKWWMEGNVLKGKTSRGEYAYVLPPNYIMVGQKNNLPIFKKIDT